MKSAIVLSALVVVGVRAQGGPPTPSGPKAGAPGGGKVGSPGAGKSGSQGAAKGGASTGAASGAKGGFDMSTFLGGILSQGGLPTVLSGISSITSQGNVPLGPAPKGCSAYEVLIARGTFEPGSFGVIVGDPLMQAIQKDMRGEDVRGYAVQYPAGMGGADTGIKDVVNRVTNKAKECPNQKFALVGYSQGGMVVSSAIAKIPADLRPKVVAMVLYGSGNGATIASADIKQKTLANCAPGDMCGNPTGAVGHFTYGSTGTAWHTRSSKYIVSAFHGQKVGYKLELSPT